MKEYFKYLGHKVKDRVTGFTGIATTLSFDLYGCVQAVVSQEKNVKDGEQKLGDNHWFDVKRLEILSEEPVMPLPSFVYVDGGDEKPTFERKPTR